jgi:hypothetical protein
VTTTKPAASPFPQRNDDRVAFSGLRVCWRLTAAGMASISAAHAKRGVCAFEGDFDVGSILVDDFDRRRGLPHHGRHRSCAGPLIAAGLPQGRWQYP